MLRRKIGDFFLTELIGVGGMSQVYLAVHPRTHERRAIKVLVKRATEPAESYARFLREVEIIRSLSHPNIVRILDSGAAEDFYYYAMEHMVAGNLSNRTNHSRIPLREALVMFSLICDAMAYAHEKGIIHRDLKPANILINASGAPMVSDFGIAKLIGREQAPLTRSSEVLGTIAYLAPEQRRSTKNVDKRADVYTLGAILYEMIMGFPPLGRFPWPRETQPDFPEAIQCILAKCLAFEPEGRHMHAGFVLNDLDEYMESIGEKPVHAHERSLQADADKQEVAARAMRGDRIEGWLRILRLGTTRERLSAVREMVETIQPREANAILKLYRGEEGRVRWGLMRVMGELRITAATPMIISELKNPYHRECAIEALGKIGSDEAFAPIRDYVMENPDSALMALLPLARTGKQNAISCLQTYLANEMAIMRQTAVRALASIATQECLEILRKHLVDERDERVRTAVIQSVHYLEQLLFPVIDKFSQQTEILARAGTPS